jgi:hypothetical protein
VRVGEKDLHIGNGPVARGRAFRGHFAEASGSSCHYMRPPAKPRGSDDIVSVRRYTDEFGQGVPIRAFTRPAGCTLVVCL